MMLKAELESCLYVLPGSNLAMPRSPYPQTTRHININGALDKIVYRVVDLCLKHN